MKVRINNRQKTTLYNQVNIPKRELDLIIEKEIKQDLANHLFYKLEIKKTELPYEKEIQYDAEFHYLTTEHAERIKEILRTMKHRYPDEIAEILNLL